MCFISLLNISMMYLSNHARSCILMVALPSFLVTLSIIAMLSQHFNLATGNRHAPLNIIMICLMFQQLSQISIVFL